MGRVVSAEASCLVVSTVSVTVFVLQAVVFGFGDLLIHSTQIWIGVNGTIVHFAVDNLAR